MGQFNLKIVRDEKVLLETVYLNRWLEAGSNYLLDTFFRATSSSLYIGLIGNEGWSALSDSDTMASHAGWTEFTRYTTLTAQATVRPSATSWAQAHVGYPGSPSFTGEVNNREDFGFQFAFGGPLDSQFVVNSVERLRGVFLTTGSAVGGTAGSLLATSGFEGDSFELRVGDAVEVEYRHAMKTVLGEINESI